MTWRGTVEALADRFRFVVPDLPGYGRSEPFPEGRHDVPMLGRWLLGFLDAVGIARADLAGVSMGGGVALWCALEAPERVRRLVPVGTYGIMDRLPLHGLKYRLSRAGITERIYRIAGASRILSRIGVATTYHSPLSVTADVVDDVVAVSRAQAGRGTFRGFLEGELTAEGLRTDLTERLGEIQAPTLFIHGSRDRIVPLRHAREAVERVPGAQLEVIPAGHWPMRERPKAFRQVFREYLWG